MSAKGSPCFLASVLLKHCLWYGPIAGGWSPCTRWWAVADANLPSDCWKPRQDKELCHKSRVLRALEEWVYVRRRRRLPSQGGHHAIYRGCRWNQPDCCRERRNQRERPWVVCLLPQELVHLKHSQFYSIVWEHRERRLAFWTTTEIDPFEQEHQELFPVYNKETPIPSARNACDDKISFDEALTTVKGLVKWLQRFCGGLISFSETSQIENDFSSVKVAKTMFRKSLADHSLEEAHHAQQFYMLMGLWRSLQALEDDPCWSRKYISRRSVSNLFAKFSDRLANIKGWRLHILIQSKFGDYQKHTPSSTLELTSNSHWKRIRRDPLFSTEIVNKDWPD